MGNVFPQIITSRIHDPYLLNNLVNELQGQLPQAPDHQLIVHGISVLIADYFNSQQHLNQYGSAFMGLLGQGPRKGSIDLLGDTEADTNKHDEANDGGNA